MASTLSGNWLYIGMYTDAGNLTQRRSPADPSGLGRYPDWAFSWPANRRILYNRCSADAEGRPWDPSRPAIAWTGSRWTGDVPDITADSPPAAGLGAFMMLPEGVARLFVPGQFVDGPWSEHYEPVGIAGGQPAAPGAQLESGGEAVHDRIRRARHGRRVSDRLHDLPADRALPLLDEEQSPTTCSCSRSSSSRFPEQLAAEKGIANGDRVRVSSARGSIEGKAMVTRRIKPMQVAGKTTYQIGFPIHWGFLGRGEQRGALANLVTPTIVDPNSFAPEYKGFLVKLEKV